MAFRKINIAEYDINPFTAVGKQWMLHIYKNRVTAVNFTPVKTVDGAVGYGYSAPQDTLDMLCDEVSQHCSLGNVLFSNVHTGHIYDRHPLGAKQLTPDAVGNRDSVVTVGFKGKDGKTRFVTVSRSFTKVMLECKNADGTDKRNVIVKKAVPGLSNPSNYDSSTDGQVLKDCKHTPDKAGGSWESDCTDATKIKGYLPSQDKARIVTRKILGEEVKIAEEPQVGHPKKGEYTLQKMSPNDARKVCGQYYDKKKDYESYLKCQLALRGSVKYQGYNPFGQAGKAPVKVNSAAPQAVGVTQYPEGSYASYASSWIYNINQLNLHNLEYENDEEFKAEQTARLTDDLLDYMGTYNNGYMWATAGCQSYDWDNFWLVANSNNFTCELFDGGMSTGNMLYNSELLQTAFYDETPEWLYESFGVDKEKIPANRIAGSSAICADAKACPEVVYDPEEEENEE